MPRFVLISILLHAFVVVVLIFGLPRIGDDPQYDIANIHITIASAVPVTNLAKGGRISTAKEAQEAARARRETPSPPGAAAAPAQGGERRSSPRPAAPRAPRAASRPSPEKPPRAIPVATPISKPPRPDPPAPVSSPRRAEAEKARIEAEAEQARIKAEAEKALAAAAAEQARLKADAERALAEVEAEQIRIDAANRLNKLARKQLRAEFGKGVLQNLENIQVAKKDAEVKRRNQEKLVKSEQTRRTLEDTLGDAAKAREQIRVGKASLAVADRIRLHIAGCWEPPVGTAANLVIDIAVSVDSNGAVTNAEVPQDAPGANERFRTSAKYRAAVHAAIRALHRCSPLPIPAALHQQFKEFILEFDPKYLSGLAS